MQILHLEASPGWGGQEIRILREAEGMRARGHEVILAIERRGGLVEEARKAGFTVYELSFRKTAWLWTLPRLLFILRRHHISVVNTHSSQDSWIGGVAARLLKIPIVRTRHLSTPIKPGMNSRLLYGSLADFVVTTCSAILPMISTQSGKKRSEMRCIATGVDPHRMKCDQREVEAFRGSLGCKKKDFLIGMACFMRSWKGIGDFLYAAHLLREIPHLRWVIIGGGHESEYRKRSEELRLMGIVHFTGHLARPIPAMSALDAFALVSTAHEGISQAILQAAYLQKPLIATSIGGLSEVCLDGETGIQVPPFSGKEIARAVLALLENPEKRARLGKNAHQLILEKFTLTHTLDGMEEVYRTLVTKKPIQ
jgi:glycosyltransferase involved in cell wall biosynthesis